MADEAKPKRRTRGKPIRLNNQQATLINRMKKGENLTDASKGIYASPAGAHRALGRARIVAHEAMHEMNLTPDMWIGEIAKMAGIVPGTEGAKREIFVKASMFQQEKKEKVDAPDLRLKANETLNKIYFGDDEPESKPDLKRDRLPSIWDSLAPSERALFIQIPFIWVELANRLRGRLLNGVSNLVL